MIDQFKVYDEIKQSFNQSAKHYDQHAFMQQEIGARLLERLDLIKTPFKTILDAGCGTGSQTHILRDRFPNSQIVGLDLSVNMLNKLRSRKTSWLRRKVNAINANINLLPFRDNQFDLIYCNLVLHWSAKPAQAFAEFKRVLKPDGLLLFTLPGPDTLQELNETFSKLDPYAHINEFTDMHDIGDDLQKHQYKNVVIDMQKLTFEYPSVTTLLKDLKMTGVKNIHPNRRTNFCPKSLIKNAIETYPKNANNQYPVTFEVIFGHAICPQKETLPLQKKIPMQVIS